MSLSFPIIVSGFANAGLHGIEAVYSGIVSVLIRLTYTPASDLYYYFEIFPDVHNYLFGETLLKPFFKVLGLNDFYIENFVALYISPNGVASAHANAAYISNLYADFGLLGVVFGSIFIGFLIQYIHIKIIRFNKNILSLTVYSYIFYAIWVLNFGSITSVLFVNGVIPIFILALFYYFFTNRIK